MVVIAGILDDKNVKTYSGEFSIKYRYVILVEWHARHMDVLVLGISSGTGGGNLRSDRKVSCGGFKRKGDCNYVNYFPTCPIEIPEDSQYPLADGVWTDLTNTTSIIYDSRINQIDNLPEEEAKYVIRLFNYFHVEVMFRSDNLCFDIKYFNQACEWYADEKREVRRDNTGRVGSTSRSLSAM
jgi:hypothetical protein